MSIAVVTQTPEPYAVWPQLLLESSREFGSSRLDETALFYMRSRGIGPAEARRLLTYAFAADVLEKIEYEPLRAVLESQVLQRFTAAS